MIETDRDLARDAAPHRPRERIAIRTFRHPSTCDEAGDLTGWLVRNLGLMSQVLLNELITTYSPDKLLRWPMTLGPA
jgi:hypothetical protein